MFLGYQNDKIAFVAETREELENMPCVEFDKIEETNAEYTLYTGEYKTKEEVEEIERLAKLAAAQRYLDETDWYVTRWMEKGKAIPEEISIAREEARQEIEHLRGDK